MKLVETASSAPNTMEIRLRNLIKMRESGRITEYANNRGRRPLSKKRVEEIAKDFDFNCLNSITVARNGKTEDGAPIFRLCDAHHRMAAIMLRHQNGEFTPADLELRVTVKVVDYEKHLSTYAGLNKGKSHTGAEKLGNSDLKCGDILDSIIEKAGLQDEKVKSSFRRNLMDLAVAYRDAQKQDRELSIDDIFAARTEVDKIIDLPGNAPTRVLTDAQKQSVAKALVYAFDVFRGIRERMPAGAGKEIKALYHDLATSAGLLIAIGTDYLNSRSEFANRDADKLAEAILRNPLGVQETSRTVARRNKAKLRWSDLVLYLRTRGERSNSKAA